MICQSASDLRRSSARPAIAACALMVIFAEIAGAGIFAALTANAVFAATEAGGESSFRLEQNVNSALLMDGASGQVLWSLNPDEKQPIASVTKIMTLILALEALRDGQVGWETPIIGSEHAKSMGGTQIWLEVGEERPFKEMLYAIAVGSANDAAVAVAEHLAGSEASFVQRMNEKARELGMSNTRFANATGLPLNGADRVGETHYSTARDVALMSRYALSLSYFRDLVSTYEFTVRPEGMRKPVLYSYNRLLRRYPGLDGIKTGFTNEAGYCISSSAVQDGLRLIAVVLGAPARQERDNAVTAMLNWGFRQFQSIVVVEKGAFQKTVRLLRGSPDEVRVVTGQALTITVPRGEKPSFTSEASIDTAIQAPLAKGTVVGWLAVRQNGQELARIPLVTESEVQRARAWDIVGRTVRQTMRSLYH